MGNGESEGGARVFSGAGPRTWREPRAASLAEQTAVAAGESARRRAGLTLAEFWEREVWPDWQNRRAPAYAGQSAARYRRWLQPLHNHVLTAITPADLEIWFCRPCWPPLSVPARWRPFFTCFPGFGRKPASLG